MKKRIALLLSAAILAVCIPLAANTGLASADDTPTPTPAKTEESNVDLTIVVPSKPAATPSPAPAPTIYLYPNSVYETLENGSRQIIKTYELGSGENPKDISRESFEREGWRYDLTDIIKTETAAMEAREHTETVTLGTDTKDTEAIVKLLAPSLEYKSGDGYFGILDLDITTVSVVTAGTKNTGFTVTATREYPNLSTNDTALVPKTTTDNGRELTLANVEWKAQNTETVDYDATIAQSYTAIATYTATGTKTVVTGYNVTAEYKGILSRMNPGATIYAAYFLGTKLPPTELPYIEQEDGGDALPTATPGKDAGIGGGETPTPTSPPTSTPTATPTPADNAEGGGAAGDGQKQSGIFRILLVLGLAIVVAVFYYFMPEHLKTRLKGILKTLKSGKRNRQETDAELTDESEAEPGGAAVLDDNDEYEVYDVTVPADADTPEADDAEPQDSGESELPAEPEAEPGGADTQDNPAKKERATRNQRLIKEAAYAEKILKNEGIPPEELKPILARIFKTGDAKAVLEEWRRRQSIKDTGQNDDKNNITESEDSQS
jgi:hypothetical protein